MESVVYLDVSSADHVVRLLAAIAAGALIGVEREYHDRAAGLRTLILICTGACLFGMLSLAIGGPAEDQARISSSIVSGVGFLGAGVIIKDGRSVKGLTTAAAIWLTAAVGLAIGVGLILLGYTALLGVLVVLWLVPGFERWVDARKETKIYDVVVPHAADLDGVRALFGEHGLDVYWSGVSRAKDELHLEVACGGKPAEHETFGVVMLGEPRVTEFGANSYT